MIVHKFVRTWLPRAGRGDVRSDGECGEPACVTVFAAESAGHACAYGWDRGGARAVRMCDQERGVGRESRLSMPCFGPVSRSGDAPAVGERVSVVRPGCYRPAGFNEVCRAGAIYCFSVCSGEVAEAL